MNNVEQQNMAHVEAFIESFWNGRGNLQQGQFLTEHYVDHAYMPHSAEGLIHMKNQLLASFPDQQSAVEEIIAQGDKVVVRMRLRGTHQGVFRDTQPSGNSVEVAVYREYRLENGLIAEHWALLDTASLLRQIGGQLNVENACKLKQQV